MACILLIKANGLYDILCAVIILSKKNTILGKLHASLFLTHQLNTMSLRMLAYWIFTYGMIRLLSDNKILLSSSYMIEMGVYANEIIVHKSVSICKSVPVMIMSMVFAYISLYA